MRIKNAAELLKNNADHRKPILAAWSHAINELELKAYRRDLIGEAKKYNMVESNEAACRAVIEYLEVDKRNTVHYLGPAVEGDVETVAREITQLVLEICRGKGEIKPPCYIVFGQKDMSVNLAKQPGFGGKTLEQALRLMLELKGNPKVTAMFGKTNGKDGNTKFAGAIVDDLSFLKATIGINVDYYLENNEAYGMLNQGNSLIITGETHAEKARIGIIYIAS
ncbi:MAG TPA: MOFRL family protein [Candidatus Aquilonibacter sp.]|nr:MOFRL family protein [Candidatus Aquilonibacter sp.]